MPHCCQCFFKDVKSYQYGEHYVAYHQVTLDENEGLELLCALHFERLGDHLPFGGKFYYANWWFAREGEPIEDRVALSLIGCEDISEVNVSLDGIDGEIRHEEICTRL